MAMMSREALKEIVRNELSAGMVNVEITDALLDQNIDRAINISSDYFNYTDFKTLKITQTSAMGGYILLSDIDDTGNQRPAIISVYPTTGVVTAEGALLGIGSYFIQSRGTLNSYMKQYANMLNRLSEFESILGRGAKVVGDKLYLDKYYDSVTVEYIPNVVRIENINEGSWLEWIIDYTTALSKRQIAQARGKYVVASNPFTTNAAELLEQANNDLIRLQEDLETKGVLLVTR